MPRDRDETVFAGVPLTHPDRVLWPDRGLTRLDLLRWYEAVADRALPHWVGRPLTLLRCPQGALAECAFMPHRSVWAPRPIRRIAIRERTKIGEYLLIDDLTSVVALVQMDVVELHTWNTRDRHVEIPDRVVFDLDPGPEVRFAEVIEAAERVRDVLLALGLRSWVKTTGGDGLHVVAPLVPDVDWQVCLGFARSVARLLVHDDPTRFTTRVPKAGREAKILVDVLRNNRTNTSVAAYSPRARPGAPISMPVAWDELHDVRPDRFVVGWRPRGPDPWAGYFRSKQRLRREFSEALQAGM